MTEHRWSKFWWQDWQADPALRSCSLAARGLWIDMLCIAHTGTPRGHVTINGTPVSPKRMATLAGCPEKECVKLLAELEEAGVFSRTANGTIYSRRMVRDTEQADAGREAAEKRWNKRGNRTGDPNSPPNSPPNRSEGLQSGKNDGKAPEENATTFHSHFVDAVDSAAGNVGEIRQTTEKARFRQRNPITPPNRGATSKPSTQEAEADTEAEKKDLNLPVSLPREAEAASPAPDPDPPWNPTAVAATVEVLAAKLEGRHRSTRLPGPLKPVRSVDEQLDALVPRAVKANHAPAALLAEARAKLRGVG